MIKHKILDLFSGIGGFSYGFEMANLGETIAFVEKDKFCQKVLRKHWKNVPIIDDIRKVNGKNFGSATIISGGFPCQPFSVAGKRGGTEDDRYLWDEMLRVISSCKPTWVIGENVEGLINIQDGMVLRSVQNDLEREGFQVQCLVIPASSVGAWHQRNRVWIIAHNVSHSKISYSYEHKGKYIKENEIQKQIGGESSSNNIPNSNSKSWNEFSNDNRISKMPQEEIFRNRSSIQESARLRSWWEIKCKFRGVPNGISFELHSDRVNRNKALGNSIVPQIAQVIGESILKAEDNDTE